MLVLTRKASETIIIDPKLEGIEPVEVKVLEVKGRQVRIGVSADESIAIHRSEVKARIDAERLEQEGDT